MRWQGRALGRRLLDGSFMVVIGVFALAPIVWGLSTSLKPANEILRLPPEIIPSTPTLDHYRFILETGILKYVLNSVVVSVGAVSLCVVIGVLAAYGLSRFRPPGHRTIEFIVVAVMSVPLASLIVPTFTFFAQIGLTNSLLGLVLLYSAYQLPMTVWILKGYFETLPPELEKAAMIDGYSRLAILVKIVLPLSSPALVASGLFVLTFAWNDFVVAVAMISSDDVRTLPVAIYNYLGFFGREWGPLTASAMVATVPVILVFVAFQRFFLSGLTGGGVKG
jgi:multiple sugar transport system permease protein